MKVKGGKMMDPKFGYPLISKDAERGYVEYDPYVELSNGKILHGGHGLMDIRAEIARSAYDANILNNPLIRTIIKK